MSEDQISELVATYHAAEARADKLAEQTEEDGSSVGEFEAACRDADLALAKYQKAIRDWA